MSKRRKDTVTVNVNLYDALRLKEMYPEEKSIGGVIRKLIETALTANGANNEKKDGQ